MIRMLLTAFASILFFYTSAQVTTNFNNKQLFSNNHPELSARNSHCMLVAEQHIKILCSGASQYSPGNVPLGVESACSAADDNIATVSGSNPETFFSK